jgi:hypothetical protein
MEVTTLLLADAAQVVGAKLYILGGGWRVTGPGFGPAALVAVFEVPWDRSNEQIGFEIALRDADGEPVRLSDIEVKIAGQMEVGRPIGHPKGSGLPAQLALNVPALPLVPGRDYEWRLTVDGEERDWRLPFRVSETPPLG